MAFEGYLLKTNKGTFPNECIVSYKSSPNQRQDLDSYRDGDGVLHREILEHKVSKIWVTTKPLHLAEKQAIQAVLDRDCIEVTYWNDETNDYSVGTFYIADPSFEVMRVLNGNDLLYKPLELTFIEY